MKPGKREVDSIIKVLEEDHETVEDAAKAVIDKAWELHELKGRHLVVGQVRYSSGYLDADDVRASRVALGPFATLKQAQGAGESLAYSSATGEQAKWAAVSLWRGTPASWYQERKKVRERAAQAAAGDIPPRELRRRYIEEWMSAHPGATTLPEHLQGNGWGNLDRFMEWREDHALQCPSCNGTGRIET